MRFFASSRTWFLSCFALVLAVGLWFVWPARAACEGAWPAPLDDVYIHADFARSTALLHPFQWMAGQGYSSGETAPLYPFLLAPAWLLGARGEGLVTYAFVLGSASLALAGLRVRELVALHARGKARALAPSLVALAAVLVWLSVGTLNFTWFSGMEGATFFAAALSSLRFAEQARAGRARRAASIRAGLWGAAMIALRPESVVLVALFALLVARGARGRSAFPPLARAALPGAAVTVAVLVANRAFTGDFASAGARLKLLGSNPYLDDVTRARELVLNLFGFVWKALGADMGGVALGLFALCLAFGLGTRSTRHTAAITLAGALAFALLVSTNGAARYQGFRYYAPALALALTGAALGASALVERAGRTWPGLVLLLGLGGASSTHVEDARTFFRRASANVHGQQVTVGKRLAQTLPKSAVVMVGDAGAIPYFSGRSSVDALGLGGYLRYPFVQAAVHGEGATLELLEHLPKERRPTHFALYPNWFPVTTSLFGHELFRVTIEDNVICGGPSKVIYEADFTELGQGDEVDRGFPPETLTEPLDTLDVADVQAERAHELLFPAPNGGWVVAKSAKVPGPGNLRRFDAGRAVGAGKSLSFVVHGVGPSRASKKLLVRADDDGLALDVTAPSGSCALDAKPEPQAFTHASCWLALADGDRVELRARGREVRVFHAWVSSAADSEPWTGSAR